MPVVEVGCTSRLPVMSNPAPPFARSTWYATFRFESTPLSVKSFTWAVWRIRFRTVTLPIRRELKRCG
jgi:hypothetical protein